MIAYEGPVTARAIALRAWRSLRGALKAMPILFLVTLILGAAWGVAVLGVPAIKTALTVPKYEDFSIKTLAAYVGAHVVMVLFWSALVAPLATSLHRFILLGERRSSILRPEVRNLFYWLAGLLLAVVVARAFCLSMAAVSFVRSLSEFLVSAGALIVAVQIMLIFPGIALGVPGGNVEKRIDSGFRMSDGAFWLVVRAALLPQIPLLLLRIGLARFAAGPVPSKEALKAAARAAANMAEGALAAPPPPVSPLRLVAAGMAGSLSVLAIALLAASLSWLYAVRRKD